LSGRYQRSGLRRRGKWGRARAATNRILHDLARDAIVIPARAPAELFALLSRKVRRSAPETREAVIGWHDACPLVDTSSGVVG
jgi:predicted nucleic acid-binding protein